MEKSTFTREYKVLCELLRDKRQASGVTQVELAEKLSETQSQISKWERGERRIDLVQLRTFCQVIGVSLSEFVAEFDKRVSKRRG